MKDMFTNQISWDEFDERRRPAPETTDFDQVVSAAMSRRGFLRSVVAFGSGAAAMGTGLFGTTSARAQTAAAGFAFKPIDAQTDYTVHVPEGYEWKVLVSWGDPLFSDAPAFDPAEGIPTTGSDRVFGENTDGMELFEIDGAQVIAVNSEYANLDINLPVNDEGAPTSAEDVVRVQNTQGVNVLEVANGTNGWEVVIDSPYNRRIHHNTPMRISGPAAGHEMLKTEADPAGTEVLGTLNNCGAGRTPWGTFLTCEENFNGFFGSTDLELEITPEWARYGIGVESGYDYEAYDPRFDISVNPNEPNRFGYVVEIDPSDASSMPVKRTALGRFKHENAACTLAADDRAVVYLGDDERGEFLYRYVSNQPYVDGGDTSRLLDDGQLYVATFSPDGTGRWVALTPEATGMEAAEILIHTRMAASAVGATTMDRPEWVAVSPVRAEAYCALTNNSRREEGATNAGGDPMEPVEGSPNPRAGNEFGQIVRWRPTGDDHAADDFSWDLYVMAGNPAYAEALANGEVDADEGVGLPEPGQVMASANVTPGNLFNSPDGMMFDSKGMLWIQTDGDDSNEGPFAGMGNNQMLVGNPETGEIARFMTGPHGCEVTGITFSTDGSTAFVGIQHPGGSWPAEKEAEGLLPRSSVIAVWRTDSQPVG